jgi:hypothetical protein
MSTGATRHSTEVSLLISWRTRAGKAFLILFGLALGLGLARRLFFGLQDPLWLDETYTAAIAAQDSFPELVRSLISEVGGPAYYSGMWLWEKIFGDSNLSLRMPSLLAGIGAPLLILLKGHPDRPTRFFWAALAALWIPSFYYAVEARAYTTLFFVGALQIILFLRLLAAPSLGRATAWCLVTALFILLHYHAAIVGAFQGLAYLAVWRMRALRTWPAALVFLPVLVWMYFHLPIVVKFSTPEVAWQPVLGLFDIILLPNTLLAFGIIFSALPLVFVGATLLWDFWLRARRGVPLPYRRNDVIAVIASIAAIFVVFAWGFITPSFAPRYLMPFAPGLLLGGAIWVRAWSGRWPYLPHLVILGLIGTTAYEIKTRASERGRVYWTWEKASADLAAAGAQRLVFIWDSPTAAISSPELTADVGSFYFKRGGRSIPTTPVILGGSGDQDPNPILLAAADRPGDAIIWGYDTLIARTQAIRHPPRLQELDPALRCRNYGYMNIGVIACLRTR